MRSTLGAWYDRYNVLKMDVGKRMQYHFDKKDPLAHVPHEERLRVASGKLMVEAEELMGKWHYAYGLREPDRPQQSLVRRKMAPVKSVRRQASPLEDPTTTFGLNPHTYTVYLPDTHSPALTITRVPNGRTIQVHGETRSIKTSSSGTKIRMSGFELDVSCDGRIFVDGRLVVS
jgi:hypothetical protein